MSKIDMVKIVVAVKELGDGKTEIGCYAQREVEGTKLEIGISNSIIDGLAIVLQEMRSMEKVTQMKFDRPSDELRKRLRERFKGGTDD